jgi:hypothetical protein
MSWTAKEFLKDVAVIDEEVITFNMIVDFDSLLQGIQHLNELVDDFVVDGYLLTDLSYRPLDVANNDILVEVTCNGEDFLREHS